MSAQPFFDRFSKQRDGSIISPTNGQTLVFDAPNGKWENISITSSTEGLWNFSTSTTMADPGSGKLRINNATGSAATQMAISVTTQSGTDVTNVLKASQAGDQIVIQDKSNAANWIRYTVSSAPTNNTSWFQIPLTYVSGSGTGSANNNLLIVAFQTTGPGGGGGGSGTVTNFSAGNLGPLFTTSVANPSTTPNLSFSLSTAGAHAFLGNNTGSTAAPTYVQLSFTDLAGSATDAQVPDILTLTRVSNLTTNGFVKTGSANGTLSVDTAAYLTSNQSITLSGDITGSGSTAITTTYNGSVPTAKGGLPTGGTAAQCLSKNSGTDYDASWATLSAATLQTASATPTGTTSTTGVMMGLGSSATITPVRTGKVFVEIVGHGANSITAGGFTFGIRYGTGTAPANGAALTGTTVASLGFAVSDVATGAKAFSRAGLITGLTLNTAIWIDTSCSASPSGTANLYNVTVTAFELP
jgi:hypothetical protein